MRRKWHVVLSQPEERECLHRSGVADPHNAVAAELPAIRVPSSGAA